MIRICLLAPILAAALFAGDLTSAQERTRGDVAQRPVPGRQRADPGKVAATDIAFARSALDNGQWTAFAEFAAPGAVLHGEAGTVAFAAWPSARSNPAEPDRWAPNTVWSSCDGSVAVSFGRMRDAEGLVGSYVTVWQRQRGRAADYRWSYHLSTPDVPQPPPPPPAPVPDPDTIIVSELSSINARTADCGAAAGLPMDELSALPAGAQSGGGEARDGTLRWRWEQPRPGEARVVVDWIRNGVWAEALVFVTPDS